MMCDCTLSEQEQLILDGIAGKPNPYAEKHPRLPPLSPCGSL